MLTKRCPKCTEVKDRALFYRNKNAKDNCSAYCKACQNLRSTSYARNNKDKIPTAGYSLKRRYGITSEQYLEMLEKQNNQCAICKQEYCISGRAFAVDHCHKTLEVRGLLCSKCNTGLGMFNDSPELLQAAKAYINKKYS